MFGQRVLSPGESPGSLSSLALRSILSEERPLLGSAASWSLTNLFWKGFFFTINLSFLEASLDDVLPWLCADLFRAMKF